MRKKIAITLSLISITFMTSCHLEPNTNIPLEETTTKQEEVVTEPKFTLLDENDGSLFYKDLKNAISNDAWYNRTIVYPKATTTINKEFLCSTIWHLAPTKSDTTMLLFYFDDAFIIGDYENGYQIEGTYEIVDDTTVLLNRTKTHNDIGIFESNKSQMTLNFETGLSNLFYSDQLTTPNSDIYFGAENGESLNDRSYTLNNTKVIKDTYKAVTTERLMFRTGPATSYDSIRISYGDLLKTNDKTVSNFLKGSELTVWARTVNKEIIGEYNNYWYYISYKSFDSSVFGWVYGAFITEYHDSNREQYESIFQQELDSINN